MDPIRSLLLARTLTVVLDPDRVAMAATRPSRDTDVDKFEDQLLQLGFVMSLDLAMTIRRLPNQTIQDLRNWMIETLGKTLGAHRPHVPLFRGLPAAMPGDTTSLYLRRVLSWLVTRPDQPCPWCSEVKPVGALDPCGHLVCKTCWSGGSFVGCPICHRRIALGDPFVRPEAPSAERVARHDGDLRLIHLAFDVAGVARDRFERLLTRATPLSKEDRAEVETVIDTMGPKAAMWLPKRIPMKESMAIAVARLWLVAADRQEMVRTTLVHLRTATDVLRVAAVLMGADPALVEPMRLRSVGRGLRRAVLEALDRQLSPDRVVPGEPGGGMIEDMMRHQGLWKRVGERLHPFEYATQLPTAALAFAAVRGTNVASPLGAELVERLQAMPSVRIADSCVRVSPWAGPVEIALRAGDARAAAARLAERPNELLRRADHLVRVACARQPDAFGEVLETLQRAMPRGAPGLLLTLAGHVAKRDAAWPRRVVFPKGQVLRAWSMPDVRAPLPADAIATIVGAARTTLIARAESKRRYARAVLDRGLGDLAMPSGERPAAKSKITWPRGSELAIPAGARLRLFLHWEDPPQTHVDLDLSVALYDERWHHVSTCDFTQLAVEGEPARAAVHSGDQTSGPPPLGASEFVDLDLDRLTADGVRRAVMVVFSYNSTSFNRLTYGFAGVVAQPQGDEPFEPRAVAQRFDLTGRSVITVPLVIDLVTRRLRWLDVHVKERHALHQVGGYRAALAHLGKDFGDLLETGARPTLWDVAAIHAAARANVIYIRERDGRITMIRRRDGETPLARLARLHASEHDHDHDGELAAIPAANAPTWVAVLRDDLAIPAGSAGYVLDPRTAASDAITRLDASDLVTALGQDAVPGISKT